MSNITITSYGHACFEVAYKDRRILFDPYEDQSVPGLQLPKDIEVDAVYCSHDHADHNAKELVSSKDTAFPVAFLQVPHDHHNGTKRGMSNITMIKCGDVTIAHMGDVGRKLREEEYHILNINHAEVIFIPVGGYFTIDAEEAKEIIAHCNNKLTILMHYRDGNIGYDVLSDIREISKVFPDLERINDTSITFDENDIPCRTITLLPKQ